MIFKLIKKKTSSLSDNLISVELEVNCNYKFGMITEKRILEYLKSEDAVCLFNNEKNIYVNLVYVLDVCVYAISTQLQEYYEINDSLTMISSQGGFWITSETEYKIETDKGKEILGELSNSQMKEYVFSNINEYPNYERYLKYEYKNQVEYVAILGKKNWKRQMGIKHKQNINAPILTRRVSILPYSKEELVSYVKNLFNAPYNSIRKKYLPAYYKKKIRLICLDRDNGILYGISNSQSKPLTKRKDRLNQIEIEFWSIIRYKGFADGKGTVSVSNINYEKFNKIIGLVENLLPKGFVSPGRTKVQWLEGI